MNDRVAVTVDVVSDVVCPWCYVGQKRLQRAVEAINDFDVQVRWRPYQLDPTIPAEGKDRTRYMLDKFGSAERIQQIHERIEALGKAEGIDFAFDAIKVAPNTLNAHRLVHWAGAMGTEVQNKLVSRLFRLNFELGENIGDLGVLAAAAEYAGMEVNAVKSLLPKDVDRVEVVEEIEAAGRMGITGVPCFLIDSKYAVMGAQDTATLINAITLVGTAKANGQPPAF